jgi:hypothetical protein
LDSLSLEELNSLLYETGERRKLLGDVEGQLTQFGPKLTQSRVKKEKQAANLNKDLSKAQAEIEKIDVLISSLKTKLSTVKADRRLSAKKKASEIKNVESDIKKRVTERNKKVKSYNSLLTSFKKLSEEISALVTELNLIEEFKSNLHAPRDILDSFIPLVHEQIQAVTERMQREQEALRIQREAEEAVRFIERRKDELLKLIETNPDVALGFPELESSLKSGLTSDQDVEQRGEFTGEIEVFSGHDDEGNTEYEFYLNTAETRYQLYSSKKLPGMLSGTEVSVKGLALSNKMALAPISGEQRLLIRGPPNTPVEENLWAQKVLAILVNTNGLGPEITKEEVEELLFADKFNTVQDFYKRSSHGKISLEGYVIGPYDLPSVCDYKSILSETLKAIMTDVQVADYSRIIIFSPRTSCSRRIGGWGTIGKMSLVLPDETRVKASVSWIFTPGLEGAGPQFSDARGLGIVAHELGHNFGVGHANSYSCPNNDVYSPDCISREYKDGLSIMGTSKHFPASQHHAGHKQEMGWLNEQNIITTTEGTYELKPSDMDLPSGTVQHVRLPLTEKPPYYQYQEGALYSTLYKLYYSIELRKFNYYQKEQGSSVSVPYVVIRFVPLNDAGFFGYTQSHVVKALSRAGETYSSRLNNYNIVLEEINSDSAKISISRKDDLSKCQVFGNCPPSTSAPIGSSPQGGFGSSPAEAGRTTPQLDWDSKIERNSDISVPYTWAFGDQYTARITFKNTGTRAWVYPYTLLRWTGAGPSPWGVDTVTVSLDQGDDIAPGQSKTFSINLRKPQSPDLNMGRCGPERLEFDFHMQLWDEQEGTFGYFGQSVRRPICV